MGLLASHGRTHHLLLRVASSWRWRRCRPAFSSSSTITMVATPHRMLKWASCRSNSCLLNIVTTAEMTGDARWPTFIPAPIFGGGGVSIWRWLCDDLPVAARSPDDDPTAIDRFVDIDRRSPGQSPAGHRQVPRRWPPDRDRENWPFAA